jgi:hypothetical protein
MPRKMKHKRETFYNATHVFVGNQAEHIISMLNMFKILMFASLIDSNGDFHLFTNYYWVSRSHRARLIHIV